MKRKRSINSIIHDQLLGSTSEEDRVNETNNASATRAYIHPSSNALCKMDIVNMEPIL